MTFHSSAMQCIPYIRKIFIICIINGIGLPSNIEIAFSIPRGRQRLFRAFININFVISLSAVVYCQAHDNRFRSCLQIQAKILKNRHIISIFTENYFH